MILFASRQRQQCCWVLLVSASQVQQAGLVCERVLKQQLGSFCWSKRLAVLLLRATARRTKSLEGRGVSRATEWHWGGHWSQPAAVLGAFTLLSLFHQQRIGSVSVCAPDFQLLGLKVGSQVEPENSSSQVQIKWTCITKSFCQQYWYLCIPTVSDAMAPLQKLVKMRARNHESVWEPELFVWKRLICVSVSLQQKQMKLYEDNNGSFVSGDSVFSQEKHRSGCTKALISLDNNHCC